MNLAQAILVGVTIGGYCLLTWLTCRPQPKFGWAFLVLLGMVLGLYGVVLIVGQK